MKEKETQHKTKRSKTNSLVNLGLHMHTNSHRHIATLVLNDDVSDFEAYQIDGIVFPFDDNKPNRLVNQSIKCKWPQ